MTTIDERDRYYPDVSMTLAVAKARIAESRAEAEHARGARAVERRPSRGVAWPTGVVTALRDSLTRRAAGRGGELCPTC